MKSKQSAVALTPNTFPKSMANTAPGSTARVRTSGLDVQGVSYICDGGLLGKGVVP